jgi:hypothetical protein
MKNSFYEEVEPVFNDFPKYFMNILLGDLNANVGSEDIKPIIWNETLHEINIYNGVRVVNFTMSKSVTVKSTIVPHRNIH